MLTLSIVFLLVDAGQIQQSYPAFFNYHGSEGLVISLLSLGQLVQSYGAIRA